VYQKEAFIFDLSVGICSWFLYQTEKKKLKQPIACLLRSYHGGWYTKNSKLAMHAVYNLVSLDLANKTIKVWYFVGSRCRSPNKIQYNKHPLFLSHNHGTWMAMVSIPNPGLKIIIGAYQGALALTI
jgi:hypothetical protein